MSYAVVWRENEGPERAGSLELDRRSVQLSGPGESGREASCTRRLTDLTDVFLERSSPARNTWNPALMLLDRGGGCVAIGSLQGVGALHELADELNAARAVSIHGR
jgi:hypothetical protein